MPIPSAAATEARFRNVRYPLESYQHLSGIQAERSHLSGSHRRKEAERKNKNFVVNFKILDDTLAQKVMKENM